MAARVVVIDGKYYVAFEQTGDMLVYIKCRDYDHAHRVADAYNL